MQTNTERVTAGIPSLSPPKRNRIDTVRHTRAISDAALKLERQRAAEAVASDGGTDTTNLLAQMGRPLSCTDIMARLRKANSNLLFELSKADPSKMGIYAVMHEPDPVTKTGSSWKKFICGMEAAYSPEFSVRHATTELIPQSRMTERGTQEFDGMAKAPKFVKETRGWRTVLARLLHERLITHSQIDRYFNPSAGRSSKNWRTLTT